MSWRLSYNAPLILTFSLLCLVFYGLDQVAGLGIIRNLGILYPEWAFQDQLWYFRLFTYNFGHANTQHLVSNLSLFLLLGPGLEKSLGWKKLLGYMVIASLATALVDLFFFGNLLLGCSGLVFMLITLLAITSGDNKGIPLTFLLVLVLFLGKEIKLSFADDQIAQFAHITGGVAGCIFGWWERKSVG